MAARATADPHALLEPSFRPMRFPPTPPDDHAQPAQRTGLETPPMQSLPTPDYTPPGGGGSVPGGLNHEREQSEKVGTAQADGEEPGLRPPRPPYLTYNTSSRAESFTTAREEPSRELLNGDALARELEAEDRAAEEDFAPVSEAGESVASRRRHVPGAYASSNELQSTPSTVSSRDVARPKNYQDSVGTPSTASSRRVARVKRYHDTESESGTVSSRDVARRKVYEADADSPVNLQDGFGDSPKLRQDGFEAGDWEKHVSYVNSDDEEVRGEAARSPLHGKRAKEGDGREGEGEGEGEGDGQDWDKHVSYISFDGEDEGNDQEIMIDANERPVEMNERPTSPRLRGKGSKRIENGGESLKPRTKDEEPKHHITINGYDDDSNDRPRKRALHKTAHFQEMQPPPPSITIRKRRQRPDQPTPDSPQAAREAREARRLRVLREQADASHLADIPPEFLATPPRNSNDLVYKHIQRANMDRFEALHNGNMIEAVVIPNEDTRSRSLRHVSKRQSLRTVSESNDALTTGSRGIANQSQRREHSLRHKSAFTPQSTPQKDSALHQNAIRTSPGINPKVRSVSSPVAHHTLRHEKRPLSGIGHSKTASNAANSLRGLDDSPRALQASPIIVKRTPRLRHASMPINSSKEGNRINLSTRNSMSLEQSHDHGLRRSSKDYRLENLPHIGQLSVNGDDHDEHATPGSTSFTSHRRISKESFPDILTFAKHEHNNATDSDGEARGTTSLTSHRRTSENHRLESLALLKKLSLNGNNDHGNVTAGAISPSSQHFLGLSPHHRNRSLATPVSVGGWSATEMEVCEAKNVTIFPHSNDSVLVVQHGSRPVSKDKSEALAQAFDEDDEHLRVAPLFSTIADTKAAPAPPVIALNGKSIHTVDSPLTNPRAPPEPPKIHFIPPTPNEEPDKQLALVDDTGNIPPQRRNTLTTRARRYSDIVVRPLFGRTVSTRSQRSHSVRASPTMATKRDDKLHPNWVPSSFWADDDYDDDSSSGDDEPYEPLPLGGDTSEHPRSRFPRSMSVRMPGFRGTGGFLQGNTLGMDRHGTNKRRHYIDIPAGSQISLRRYSSNDSMRRLAAARAAVSAGTGGSGADSGRRSFLIPGTRKSLQFVGLQTLRARVRRIRDAKEEEQREKRRSEIRDQIGMRIVHGT